MTDSANEKSDFALKLKIRDEVYSNIEARFESEIQELKNNLASANTTITSLENELSNTADKAVKINELEKVNHKLKHDGLIVQRELRESQAEGGKLKRHADKYREKLEKVKAELEELRELNPKVLAKRLAKAKKDLQTKNDANTSLSIRIEDQKKKNKILETAIGVLKSKAETATTSDEPSAEQMKSYVLYESNCGKFAIIGTGFESKSHPFIGQDLNYRVLDQESGASLIAQWKNEEVIFEEMKPIPEDVMLALKSHIVVAQGAITKQKK